VLFLPAIVLAVWAVFVSVNSDDQETMMVFFLVTLSCSVTAAEIMRIHNRKKIMRKVKESNDRRDADSR
jgi:hypothetical protein